MGSKVDEIPGFTIFSPDVERIYIFCRGYGICFILIRNFGLRNLLHSPIFLSSTSEISGFSDILPIFWDCSYFSPIFRGFSFLLNVYVLRLFSNILGIDPITPYIERRVRTRLLGWGLVVHTLYRVK